MPLSEKPSVGEGKHSLELKRRERLTLDGVEEVISFDESGAELKCENGRLFVEGEEIRISNLSTESGEVNITGKINAISYADDTDKKRRGFMGRLFG